MSPRDVLRLGERFSIGLEAGESHFREFKSALLRDVKGSASPRELKSLCRDIAETLVAFANADGGELLVGVEDDGSVTGIPHKESHVKSMKNAYVQYLHPDTPLPAPIIGDIKFEGHRVLYFSIGKNLDYIVLTSDGRCLQRSDRQNQPVPAETIQADRGEVISRGYDRVFVDGATTGDIDLEVVGMASEQIAPGYSPEKVLQYLGLAEYGEAGLRFRKAALLLFSKEINKWQPRCSVRILRVKGTELGVGENYNVTSEESIAGTVMKLIEDAWDALRPFLARIRFDSSGLFRESLIYPEVACREALVNAIAHRDYSREGIPIEVFIFDDRIEFRSPGGLLSSISLEKLLDLKGVHESRNVLLARTLRELGYIREIGEGIPRIFRAMRDSELVDPQITSDRDNFTVTLQHKSIFTHQDIEWLAGYREFDLNKNEQRVVLLGRDGHLLSTNEIIRVASIVDTDDFRALYQSMRMKGLIYNAKRSLGRGGRRREIGRFQVRPSKEAEQFFGELLEALREIGGVQSLSPAITRVLRGKLSPRSPYAEKPDWSLQELGFIDAQKRFLPKAFSYVPELQAKTVGVSRELKGEINTVKPAGYGFIRGDDGTDYFFHISGLTSNISWEAIKPGDRASFKVKPGRTEGERDIAVEIRFS